MTKKASIPNSSRTTTKAAWLSLRLYFRGSTEISTHLYFVHGKSYLFTIIVKDFAQQHQRSIKTSNAIIHSIMHPLMKPQI
jgi:hypothetical protein